MTTERIIAEKWPCTCHNTGLPELHDDDCPAGFIPIVRETVAACRWATLGPTPENLEADLTAANVAAGDDDLVYPRKTPQPVKDSALEKIIEAARIAFTELAALVAKPDLPDFTPVIRNNNYADAECLLKAYSVLREALAAWNRRAACLPEIEQLKRERDEAKNSATDWKTRAFAAEAQLAACRTPSPAAEVERVAKVLCKSVWGRDLETQDNVTQDFWRKHAGAAIAALSPDTTRAVVEAAMAYNAIIDSYASRLEKGVALKALIAACEALAKLNHREETWHDPIPTRRNQAAGPQGAGR